MIRIHYAIVAIQMEKFWAQEIAPKDIDAHCEMMQQYVEACGWSIDEYIREMMMRGEVRNEPPGEN